MEIKVTRPEPVPQPEPTVDIIGMPMRMAKILAGLMLNVGGSPSGPRGDVDEFRLALYKQGIYGTSQYEIPRAQQNHEGVVYMKDTF